MHTVCTPIQVGQTTCVFLPLIVTQGQ